MQIIVKNDLEKKVECYKISLKYKCIDRLKPNSWGTMSHKL